MRRALLLRTNRCGGRVRLPRSLGWVQPSFLIPDIRGPSFATTPGAWATTRAKLRADESLTPWAPSPFRRSGARRPVRPKREDGSARPRDPTDGSVDHPGTQRFPAGIESLPATSSISGSKDPDAASFFHSAAHRARNVGTSRLDGLLRDSGERALRQPPPRQPLTTIRHCRIVVLRRSATLFSFIETALFTRLVAEYLSEPEYRQLQQLLMTDPEAGAVVQGSGGVRKLRWAAPGRGKRGGYRVIYFVRRSPGIIWMLTMYPKNVADNIPAHILRQIREEVEDG